MKVCMYVHTCEDFAFLKHILPTIVKIFADVTSHTDCSSSKTSQSQIKHIHTFHADTLAKPDLEMVIYDKVLFYYFL